MSLNCSECQLELKSFVLMRHITDSLTETMNYIFILFLKTESLKCNKVYSNYIRNIKLKKTVGWLVFQPEKWEFSYQSTISQDFLSQCSPLILSFQLAPLPPKHDWLILVLF